MTNFIKDLKEGQKISSVYLLKKKQMLKTKHNKSYLSLLLCDKSGSIEARMWDNAEIADTRVSSGSAVLVKAEVVKWRENTQMSVVDIQPAADSEYNKEDLVRSVENIDEILEKVRELLGSMKDKWLCLLADEFLTDKELMPKVKVSPGAKSWHNAYIGGLLEHTYEVMFVAEKVCQLYPLANRDLVIMGAFVHDMGKVIEIDPDTFEYTLEGGLVGHLPLGFELLSKKMDAVNNFPDDLKVHLKHIILSHHGEYDQQSPVLPKTLEATIVYHSDDLLSQANAVREVITSQPNSQQDWSNYISIKNRKYLLKK
ncbi:MAG: HD domain-containing protein [Candidatus Omnitrophota bacterium]